MSGSGRRWRHAGGEPGSVVTRWGAVRPRRSTRGSQPVRQGLEVPDGRLRREDRREGRPEDPDPAGHRGGAAPAPGADAAGGRRHRQPAAARDEAGPADGRGREAPGLGPPGPRAGRPDARDRSGQGGGVRVDRAAVLQPAGLGREADGGPQDPARPGAAGRPAGQEGGRDQRHDRAEEAGRAHPAPEPARAGQDAGAGHPEPAVDVGAVGAEQRPVPRRGARQDRVALRQGARRRRAGEQQRRGPDARGREVDDGHRRAAPARPDPRQHHRPAAGGAAGSRPAPDPGHAGDRRAGRRQHPRWRWSPASTTAASATR
ncbi:MAG: hypothetical protein JWN55_26 [Frankiales bacterium]|nr:hypothetical protein [Frankiales bacterium]